MKPLKHQPDSVHQEIREREAREKELKLAVPVSAKLKSKTTQAVLDALRANVESDKDSQWRGVYLDNALGDLRKIGINLASKQFSAHCATLSRLGLYRDTPDRLNKGIWGYVRMAP